MEKIDERYRMLFLFENIYGIYRAYSNSNITGESIDYNLYGVYEHDSVAPVDVLKDVAYLIKSGEVHLQPNDVICIKINGGIVSYEYKGNKIFDIETVKKSFSEVPKFLEVEKKRFVSQLHGDNKVLGVLEDREYRLNELEIKNQKIFCIEREVYKNRNRQSLMTEYSLYLLQGGIIKNINPYSKPFSMIKNALYYYKKKSRGNSLLVLDRHELEMIKDFYQLQQVII